MNKSASRPNVTSFFHHETSTITHVVVDTDSNKCCIIDPVLDYDANSGHTHTFAADEIIAFVQGQQLKVCWILETHAHADHVTSAPYLKSIVGGKIGIGEQITQIQAAFSKIFNLGPDFSVTGRQFDQLLENKKKITIGNLSLEVINTPGHTPACVSYLVGNCAFVGDTLFMPDYGTARCDFPGGNATELYRSIRKLLSLPLDTKLYLCHDYMPGGRAPAWQCTVADQLENNIHIHRGVSLEEFIAMRAARDQTLNLPALLIPSIQMNIRGGESPPPEDNGVAYLKVPLNLL